MFACISAAQAAMTDVTLVEIDTRVLGVVMFESSVVVMRGPGLRAQASPRRVSPIATGPAGRDRMAFAFRSIDDAEVLVGGSSGDVDEDVCRDLCRKRMARRIVFGSKANRLTRV
jgi:hypothetical protein